MSEVAAQAETHKGGPAMLEEMVVTGSAEPNPVTPVTTRYGTQHHLVTEEQIREQQVYDFPSALRNVPGVMYQSKNLMGSQTNHSLYIRGRGASHPSADVVILFDGVPRYGALFGQVLGDGIALPVIGAMEVFKSPQPSQFGNGYAAVNVLPKFMKDEGREVVLDASGGSFATIAEALSGGVRDGPLDVYLSQSWASTDGHRDHARAQQQNYYANGGYAFNQHWNVRLLANAVDSQTLAPMPELRPTAINGVLWPDAERFDTRTFLAILTLDHRYDTTSGYLKAYRNDTTFDLLQELDKSTGQRYGGGTGGLWSRQELALYGLRAQEKILPWPGGEILLGADLDLTRMKNTQSTYSGLSVAGINGGRAERTWDFPDTRLFSPYGAFSQMFGTADGVHLIPSAGFRYFHHSDFEAKTAGQAGLVVGYNQTDLNLSFARGVNYPSPVVVMNMVLTNAPVNDPGRYWKTIKPEVVDHFELALTHTWPRRASLGATLFQDKGSDRYLAYMGGPIPVLFNDPIGNYETRGLELTGTIRPIQSLECFAAAVWLDTRAKGRDGVERRYLPYTPGFQFQAGADWTFLERYRLRLDMQHLRDVYGGTSARGGTFNFAQLTDASRVDDITLVNGRLAYRFSYRPWRLGESEVYAAINNLLNRRYEYARGYSMPGTTVFAGLSLRFN